MNYSPPDVAVVSQGLVVLHLAPVVKKPNLGLSWQLPHRLDGRLQNFYLCGELLAYFDVLIRVLGGPDRDFGLGVLVLHVEVPVLDLLLGVADGFVDAEHRHLVLVELSVHRHLDGAIQHGNFIIVQQAQG